MKNMKNIFAIIFIVALVGYGIYETTYDAAAKKEKIENNEAAAPSADIKVGTEKGDLAADFELETLDGEKLALSDLRGQKVIVNMWATWCPPCIAEMPDMQKFYEENKDKGITVLAVNLTIAERVRGDIPKFIEDFGLTFPVVLDENGEASSLYNVRTIPTSLIIDSNGVIQQKIVGPMDQEMMRQVTSSLD